MKAIKYLICVLLMLFISCDRDDDRAYTNEDGRFVRFYLQTDRNNQPLEAPQIDLGAIALNVFEKDDIKQLKIPVALTSAPLSEPVQINFNTIADNLNGFEINPASQLSFEGSQLVDTIFVSLNERYDPSLNPQLKFELISSSDPNINLGTPNEQLPLDELTINFVDYQLTYELATPSRVDLAGTNGEEVQINIAFPNGFIDSEVDPFSLLSETQSNFIYQLTPLPNDANDEISFKFQVGQDFTDNDLLYKTGLILNEIPGYSRTGNPVINLLRDPITPRERSVNTAANFYDVSNPFYRTFGVNWMDFNEDGLCEWRDFNAFTVPVIVSADDPNAILGDDMGTADPSDDIYYHAFRLGFESPVSNTTNPFNLRRWFTNESSNPDISSGLNIVPALEFYPENGNSNTMGTVQVLDQTIQIGTTATNGGIIEFITISGSGTYQEISPGVFEIILEFNATNSRLFGGTRTAFYHIYNTNTFTDPPLLTESCFTPLEL
ncbi:hypothetical protein [Nonlabens xiamenensis]|uniref:hypothetical protein n=1 Tax=Nonlabens xiamenensis TaxID=2341043 RepID=UPI000F6151D9|nr:hypothetical protein [Nonlabens xiamenensis]